MEKFKKTIRKRLNFYIGVILLFSVLFGGNMLHWFTPIVKNPHYVDFFSGVQVGMFIGIEIYLVYRVAYYMAILKDDKALRTLYIKENDERNMEIAKKSGIESYKFVIVILLAGAIIVGYFSMEGFIALMGAALVEILVRAGLYAYYSRAI